MLMIAAACAGCWEEIHYTPAPSAAPSDEADQDENSAANDETETAPETPRADPLESFTAAMPAADAPATEAPPEVKAATPHEQLLAWRAASKWSLAAAAYAKGLDTAQYEPFQQEAAAAAAELGLELPELPTTPDENQREAAVIDALRTGAGAQLADEVTERFGPQTGAAARLAVGSHLLLLIYSPQDPDAASHAVALREAAEAAGLPKELWQPLADLLEKQAEFLDVRSSVFELHRQVEAHLGRL